MHLYPGSVLEKLGFEQLRQATLRLAWTERTRELLELLSPFSDPKKVSHLLEQTWEMIGVIRHPDPLPLQELPDIRDFLKQARIEGSIIPLSVFPEILLTLIVSRNTKVFFKSRGDHYPQLFALAQQLIPLKEVEQTIKEKVTDNGELRDDASPELKSIRKRLNSRKNDLRTAIQKIMRVAAKDGYTSDEGATIRNGRMVIPIQAEFKRRIQGFVHDVSSTGQTVYIEPAESLHLNNEIRQLELEEQQEIERILRELTAHIRLNKQHIELNIEYLAQLDLIRSKAQISLELEGEIPVLSTSSFLKLKDARNPSLLLKNRGLKKDREPVIPLNLELEEDEQCLMITGPNAGGKSVALKTVGICSLMMQCGFALPADPVSELPVYNGLFVDLGDDQSIENDLSTFSSRLQWMRETLRLLESGSLVLIDEAAAGTDPEEGGALFQSFIEHVLEKDCTVLVTTHHGSLKVFAHEHPLAVNGSMEFDQETLSPTYRFKKGIPGSSYAFEIAERMKLPDTMLKRSRVLLGEAKSKLESLISELESRTQQASQLKEKYQDLQLKAEKDRNRYLNKLESINKEKDRIREKALLEAKSIMDKANQKVEQAVERIVQQQKSDKEEIRDVRKELEEEKKHLTQDLEEAKEQREARYRKTEDPPAVGDHVRFLDGNTTGQLIEIRGKNATVQADGLRLRTRYKNLVKVEQQKKPRERKAASTVMVGDSDLVNQSVQPRLDVRGKRTEDALNEVMHYLDRSVFRGMRSVEILHGKGDGILKEQIHKYLDDRPEVRSFALGHEDRGGAGITVIELS